MRCLALALLPLAAAWVAAPPRRRPTRLAAKKKSRKLERLQELKEVSGAELDATEQWAANLESRLDAAMDGGDRDELQRRWHVDRWGCRVGGVGDSGVGDGD